MRHSTRPGPTEVVNSDIALPRVQNDGSPSLGFQARCSSFVLAAILQGLSATWRVDNSGLELLDELAQSRRRHILAFWHRHYITLFRLFRHRPIIAITNRSHRGQVIADICQRSGIQSLQVPGKGSKLMLESLNRAADQGLGLAIAVDGPLGPACEVKRVVLHLAARLECPIVPVSVAAKRKRTFAGRWDDLELPHLFSRISFVIGSCITVAPTSRRAELRERGAQLKQAIEFGTTLARQRVGTA